MGTPSEDTVNETGVERKSPPGVTVYQLSYLPTESRRLPEGLRGVQGTA